MASNVGASCSREGAAALPDSPIVLDSDDSDPVEHATPHSPQYHRKKNIFEVERQLVENEQAPSYGDWVTSARAHFLSVVNQCVLEGIFSLENFASTDDFFERAAALYSKDDTSHPAMMAKAKKIASLALDEASVKSKIKQKEHPDDFKEHLAARLAWEQKRFRRHGQRLQAHPASPASDEGDESEVDEDEDQRLELPQAEESAMYTRGEKMSKYFPSQGVFYDTEGIKRTSQGHSSFAAFFNALKGMSDMGFHQQVFRLLSSTTPPAMLEVAKGIYFSSQTAEKLLPKEILAKAVEVAFKAHAQRSFKVGKSFKIHERSAGSVGKDIKSTSGYNLHECNDCTRKSKHNILGIFGESAQKMLKGKRATIVYNNIRCVPCENQTITSTLMPNSDIVMLMPFNYCTVAIQDIFKKKTETSRTIEFSNGWKYTCKACVFHLHTGDPAEVVAGSKDYDGEFRSITVLVPANPRIKLTIIDPENPDSEEAQQQQLGEVDALFYVRMNSQEKLDHNAQRKKDYEKERLRPKAAALAEGPRTLPPRAARDAAAAATAGERR